MFIADKTIMCMVRIYWKSEKQLSNFCKLINFSYKYEFWNSDPTAVHTSHIPSSTEVFTFEFFLPRNLTISYRCKHEDIWRTLHFLTSPLSDFCAVRKSEKMVPWKIIFFRLSLCLLNLQLPNLPYNRVYTSSWNS